jgi:hypothetical protein
MKKIPQILLILLILAQTTAFAQAIWNGTADTTWYNASQTEFTITTAEQLAGFAELVNNGKNFMDKTIKLGANIMLNDTADWRNWEKEAPKNRWKPIGSSKLENYYFDGNGFVVSGVYINSGSYIGLFGGSRGRIENLGVIASYIKGDRFVGGLVGYGYDIANCYSTAWVNGDNHVGGLAGTSNKIARSYSAGIVKAIWLVGGLTGLRYEVGVISDSYFTGSVTGTNIVGGLVGWNSDEAADAVYTMINCYSTGRVTVTRLSGEVRSGELAGVGYSKIINSYYIHNTSFISFNEAGRKNGKTMKEMKKNQPTKAGILTRCGGLAAK